MVIAEPMVTRKRTLQLCVMSCLVVFNACSQSPDFNTAGAPMAEAPQRKAGLWKHEEVLDGHRMPPRAECISGPIHMPDRAGTCEPFGFRRASDGKIFFEGKCKSLDGRQTSSTQWMITGHLDQSYVIEGEMRVATTGLAPMHTTFRDSATYLGACTAPAVTASPQ